MAEPSRLRSVGVNPSQRGGLGCVTGEELLGDRPRNLRDLDRMCQTIVKNVAPFGRNDLCDLREPGKCAEYRRRSRSRRNALLGSAGRTGSRIRRVSSTCRHARFGASRDQTGRCRLNSADGRHCQNCRTEIKVRHRLKFRMCLADSSNQFANADWLPVLPQFGKHCLLHGFAAHR